MKITRIWAMPNKWTFTIKPIKELLDEEVTGGLWCDPFCGQNSPAKVRNDLNPENEAEYHLDALEFLQLMEADAFDGVLFDPPYSFNQAAECYKSFGKEKLTSHVSNMGYWSKCKKEIARIVKPGGKVISFGWNTNGMGNKQVFDHTRILIVPHGGGKYDTLVTVQTKTAESLLNT